MTIPSLEEVRKVYMKKAGFNVSLASVRSSHLVTI